MKQRLSAICLDPYFVEDVKPIKSATLKRKSKTHKTDHNEEDDLDDDAWFDATENGEDGDEESTKLWNDALKVDQRTKNRNLDTNVTKKSKLKSLKKRKNELN